MMCNVVEPSTTWTSSSPFGWRSHAPSPVNLALKILPSRNGANVAKAPLPFRSASVISGLRPCNMFNFANWAFRSMIVSTSLPPFPGSWISDNIAIHSDFRNRQNRYPAIQYRIMTAVNGSASLDWDDVRVFLAVARHGSLRAAGRALGLSQPTIGRRLATFESTFGGPTLFDRLPEGLRLNAAGDALMSAAEELESAALALERRRAAASPALSGTVRVSVGEWGGAFVARHLDQSSETGLPPALTLELVESWETANLARRDADLALRHGAPEGGSLYVSKVGVIACAVYRRR